MVAWSAVNSVIVALAVAVAGLATALVLLRRRVRGELDRLRAARESVAGVRAELAGRDAALTALPEGVVVLDSTGEVAYVNRAARDMLGRRFAAADELAPAALRDACLQALRDRSPTDVEFDTAGRTVHADVVPAEDAGILVVLRDVTEQRAVDRIRRDFVVNASHELKTPASSILALAEALKEAEGRDATATERFLALLERESMRLSRLVTDLLDLSRLEAGGPAREQVRLDRVVKAEAERIRPGAETGGIRLVLEVSEETTVLGSESDLGLMVHNLLDNAVRYSPQGGQVRVTLHSADGVVALAVSDTGIGIASGDLTRIFERFYRGDPARSRETGGTGLGLSIVKHVAEAHGGEVGVRSVLSAGSTFTVRLPLADR